jgi:beta-mannosidase
MPLQWGYARSVRKQAVRQTDAAVRMLGHHPSVVIWCGHNEPLAIDTTEIGDAPLDLAKAAGRMVAGMELPTFNRTFLDRAIARTFRRADGTRPVIPHSGVWPHLPQLDGTDTHVYFGWYHNTERDFPRFLAAVPRMARFVSEFGAQAVPDTADFMEPEKWPHLDWDHLTARHRIQKSRFDEHVPPADHETFEDWRDATQRYQALVIERHIRELRRIKYRPNGGFTQFAFADAAPLVSWSVLDHERVPKLGYEALRRACAPVIVVADRLPATVQPGEPMVIDVHVVSDLREPLADLACAATISWSGGERTWRFAGDVGADTVVLVGRLQLDAPFTPGPVTLELEVTGPGLPAPVTDRDQTIVTT